MLNTRSIKINEYSDSDSKLQIENIFRKKVKCSKLQIENIFRKKAIRGIFNCWLDKNGIDKELELSKITNAEKNRQLNEYSIIHFRKIENKSYVKKI